MSRNPPKQAEHCDQHEDHHIQMGVLEPEIFHCPVCIVDWITCNMVQHANNPTSILELARKSREFVSLHDPKQYVTVKVIKT
jgi:hypothetical protein